MPYYDNYEARFAETMLLVWESADSLLDQLTVDNQNQIHGILFAKEEAQNIHDAHPTRKPLTNEEIAMNAIDIEDDFASLDQLAETFTVSLDDAA